MRRLPIVIAVAVAACGRGGDSTLPDHDIAAPLSRAADGQMVDVPAGNFVSGSTPEERDAAYDDFLATAGHDGARANKWFDAEEDRHLAELPAFRIDLMPVTNAQYAELVAAGGAKPPTIDETAWKAQGFQQDFATEVTRSVWVDGGPPPGREEHPVVLVTWADAKAYCEWRGRAVGSPRRLPTAVEYEKASRGSDGLSYPWGNLWDATKLNSAVGGPNDTVPVGSYPAGAAYSIIDLAGNVFQWTATRWDADEMTVKGSAWDDFAGVGRGASRHGRPTGARHVIVGFRCASDPESR